MLILFILTGYLKFLMGNTTFMKTSGKDMGIGPWMNSAGCEYRS